MDSLRVLEVCRAATCAADGAGTVICGICHDIEVEVGDIDLAIEEGLHGASRAAWHTAARSALPDNALVSADNSPDYLRSVLFAVREFGAAFDRYMELHEFHFDGNMPAYGRGVFPSVVPRNGSNFEEVLQLRLEVNHAAGRAMMAPKVTNCYMAVQGSGMIDVIAAWQSIEDPHPVLEPKNVTGLVAMMVGRLEAMIAEAEANRPPSFGPQALHPLIWGAAGRLWQGGHRRRAVQAAAEALITQVKSLTGRYDLQETPLWQNVLSEKPPEPDKPRLRWPGDPTDLSVKTMNDGLRQFAPGVQMTIRNSATHVDEELGEQDALERLATLSLLARWVDTCELYEHSGGGPDRG